MMKLNIINTILGCSIFYMTSLSADPLQKERAQLAQQIHTAYNKGINIRAFDPDKALLHFKNVLKLDPQHSKAQYQVNYIRTNRDKILKEKQTRALTNTFKQMRFEVIDLSGETLADSLEIMYSLMERDYGEAHGVNFVLKDPQSKIKNKQITLNLKNLPASVVLNYIVEQAGANYKIGEYAIEIFPAR